MKRHIIGQMHPPHRVGARRAGGPLDPMGGVILSP